MSVVSQQGMDDTLEFCEFHGIPFAANRHIFRAAADADREAYELVMSRMAAACRIDPRRGINGRIRDSIEAEKARLKRG